MRVYLLRVMRQLSRRFVLPLDDFEQALKVV
jgi:hypothetical protein